MLSWHSKACRHLHWRKVQSISVRFSKTGPSHLVISNAACVGFGIKCIASAPHCRSSTSESCFDSNDTESVRVYPREDTPAPVPQIATHYFIEKLDSNMKTWEPYPVSARLLQLVHRRQDAREKRDWPSADALWEQIRVFDETLVLADHSDGTSSILKKPQQRSSGASALTKLAHEALASPNQVAVNNIISTALELMANLSEQDGMPGRRAADVAYHFALAGCESNRLIEKLGDVVARELDRTRKSTPHLTAVQIAERLTVAGLRSDHQAFTSLSTILRPAAKFAHVANKLSAGELSLHSPRPLQWLWRHTSCKRRGSSPLQETSIEVELSGLFADCTLPLVVDLGCGSGASLLSLARALNGTMNCLGLEVDESAVRYGRGLAKRLDQNNLQFLTAPAIPVLEALASGVYPGQVALLLLQFPTPFARKETDFAETSDSGNQHLAQGPESDAFLGNPRVLKIISHCLRQGATLSLTPLLPKLPMLFVQSNAEDVAVAIRTMAERVGLYALDAEDLNLPSIVELTTASTQRQRLYRGPKATGQGWLRVSPLHCFGALSETEAHYQLEHLPIYRCCFAARMSRQKSVRRNIMCAEIRSDDDSKDLVV